MSYIDTLSCTDVETVDDLIEYTRSTFGVITTLAERKKFKANYKRLLAQQPHITPRILADVVRWARKSGRKVRSLNGIPYLVNYALQADAVPELDPRNAAALELRCKVNDALTVETDPDWRLRLLGSVGPELDAVLSEWRRTRSHVQEVA